MDRRDFMQYTGFGLAGLMLPGFGKAVAAETLATTIDVRTKKAIADTALNAARDAGASYCDVRIGRYLNQFVVTREDKVQNVVNTESLGVGIRVIANGTWGFSATSDLSSDAVAQAARRAVAIAKANSRTQTAPVQLAPTPALGEVSARGKLRMRDEIDQQIVEEIDQLGTKIGGILEEQFGDGARDFAAPPRIAAFDDIVQSGNERRGNGHETTRSGHAAGAPLVEAAPQSGNLAARGERSVRPGTARTTARIGRKKPRLARDGPCPGGSKALYQRQFIFSYDPRSESGPERTRSFLLPERGLAEDARPDACRGSSEAGFEILTKP